MTTIAEPLPDLQWGKGTWQDYISNWRTKDTNWMQERLILRYQTTASRNAAWPTPAAGQVTYNDQTHALELYRSGAWARALMLQYLDSTQDTNAGVSLSHTGTTGKGIILGPGTASAGLVSFNAPVNVMNGVLSVDSDSVDIKTGLQIAKLSTDSTHLLSDSPIRAPGLYSTGVIDAAGLLTAATVNTISLTVSSTVTFSGATLTGGILNGASGTIGGVNLNANVVTVPSGTPAANAAGIQSGQGYFYGDSSGAQIRQRTSVASAAGAAYVQVTSTGVGLSGTLVTMLGQPQVASNRSMQYITTAGTFNAGPVIVQAGDPIVGNVPEGTIWCDT